MRCLRSADIISGNYVHKEIDVDDKGNYETEYGRRNVLDWKFADSQLWQRMTINWNGDAEICCENYKQEYILGNVKDIPITEIWRGSRFQAVRNAHAKGEWWRIPQCRKCTIPHMNEIFG